MAKEVKAEILKTVSSRHHKKIVHPAGEGEKPVILTWPVEDDENGAQFLAALKKIESEGYIKIIPQAKKKPKEIKE